MGERRPYKPEVAGSIPVPPTIQFGIAEFGLGNLNLKSAIQDLELKRGRSSVG